MVLELDPTPVLEMKALPFYAGYSALFYMRIMPDLVSLADLTRLETATFMLVVAVPSSPELFPTAFRILSPERVCYILSLDACLFIRFKLYLILSVYL